MGFIPYLPLIAGKGSWNCCRCHCGTRRLSLDSVKSVLGVTASPNLNPGPAHLTCFYAPYHRWSISVWGEFGIHSPLSSLLHSHPSPCSPQRFFWMTVCFLGFYLRGVYQAKIFGIQVLRMESLASRKCSLPLEADLREEAWETARLAP